MKIDRIKTLKISVDGPNEVGKTSALSGVPVVFSALQTADFNFEYAVPLVKVAEPPKILVCPDDPKRTETWRQLTKSHSSLDETFTPAELKNPLTQACLFSLSGRLLELRSVYDYPYPTRENYREKIWSWSDSNVFGPYGGATIVKSDEEAANVGVGTRVILHDRSRLSTVRYQGSDSVYGDRVMGMLGRMYRDRMLMREAMTIVVIPTSEAPVNVARREDGEVDRYVDGLSPTMSYLQLREVATKMMTDNFVVIENDPTGSKNSISTTTLIIALLVQCAVEHEQRGKKIPWSTPDNIVPIRLAPSYAHLELCLDWVNIDFSRRYSRDIGHRAYDGGEKPFYMSGDVGVRVVDNIIELLLMENASGYLQR